MFAQGESLIRDWITDTILVESPQVDTNKAALIQRWCMDIRVVVSVVCAAIQAIVEHAPGVTGRTTRVKQDSKIALRHSTDNRHLSHYWRF
jgi:hypothetical protein